MPRYAVESSSAWSIRTWRSRANTLSNATSGITSRTPQGRPPLAIATASPMGASAVSTRTGMRLDRACVANEMPQPARDQIAVGTKSPANCVASAPR